MTRFLSGAFFLLFLIRNWSPQFWSNTLAYCCMYSTTREQKKKPVRAALLTVSERVSSWRRLPLTSAVRTDTCTRVRSCVCAGQRNTDKTHTHRHSVQRRQPDGERRREPQTEFGSSQGGTFQVDLQYRRIPGLKHRAVSRSPGDLESPQQALQYTAPTHKGQRKRLGAQVAIATAICPDDQMGAKAQRRTGQPS